MAYCRIHGKSEGYDYCPDCYRNEEESAADRAELLSEVADLNSKVSNLERKLSEPGDYVCPACLRKTLIRNAKRCGSCGAIVEQEDLGYWARIRKGEEEAARERERRHAEEQAAAKSKLAEEKRAAQRAAEQRVDVSAIIEVTFRLL